MYTAPIVRNILSHILHQYNISDLTPYAHECVYEITNDNNANEAIIYDEIKFNFSSWLGDFCSFRNR